MINNIEGQSKSELIKIVTEQQNHDIQREAYIKSLQAESDALRTQLAKANERVKELEHENRACAIAIRELIARGDIEPLMVGNEALDKIVNKFAIDNQIKGAKALIYAFPLNACDQMKEWVEQLRKEQEQC